MKFLSTNGYFLKRIIRILDQREIYTTTSRWNSIREKNSIRRKIVRSIEGQRTYRLFVS